MAEIKLTLWAVIGRDKAGAEWLAGIRMGKADAVKMRDQVRQNLGLYKYVLRPCSTTLRLNAGSGEG